MNRKSTTTAADPTIAEYMAIARRYPFLTPEAEASLARDIRKGNQSVRDKAVERLTMSHIPLAIQIARQFGNNGIPLADLIQQGLLGMQGATKNFDPTKARFSTFAYRPTQNAIKLYVADHRGNVRIPISAQKKRSLVKKEADAMTVNGVIPYSAVGEKLGMSDARVSMFLTLGQESSLNFKIGDGDIETQDLLADENAMLPFADAEDEHLHAGLHDALSELNDREKRIVKARFGIGEEDDEALTLEELSVEFGITRERVRQIQVAAMKKLANKADVKKLMELLT